MAIELVYHAITSEFDTHTCPDICWFGLIAQLNLLFK